MPIEDYEPPRPGIEDELFGSGPDWHNNACLGMPGGFAYIEGYLRAGDVLAQHVETTHHDQDFLVYPMVFVYRHYLELRLKDLRKDCFELLDREVDPKLNHSLGAIWKDCRGALDELWDETFGDNDLDAGERLVNQFIAVDPKSTAFRYDRDFNGRASLPEDLLHINIRQLRETMSGLSSMLDGLSEWIAVHLEWKQEMDWDARE